MSLDAMKQALDALEECTAYTSSESWSPSMTRDCEAAITALRAAIEQARPDELMIWKSRAMSAERIIEKFMQPEQEPVFELGFGWLADATKYPRGTKLYATPPRQWQGLTQREIDELWDLHHDDYGNALSATGYERAIEAKLRERNA